MKNRGTSSPEYKAKKAEWQREYYWKYKKYAGGHGDKQGVDFQKLIMDRANKVKHTERLRFYKKFFEHKLICQLHPDVPARLSGVKRKRYRCPKCRELSNYGSRHSRRAREKMTYQLRDAVFKGDGHRCVQCGSNKELTLDHILPVSQGGTNCPSNLQTLCNTCNGRKSDHIDIFIRNRKAYCLLPSLPYAPGEAH